LPFLEVNPAMILLPIIYLMMGFLADCFALTLANREGGILVTSDRKEFEPVVHLNICQINFIR
jgi:hypothetical protein